MNDDGTPHNTSHVECKGPDCEICAFTREHQIEMKPYEMPNIRSFYGVSSGGGMSSRERLRQWGRTRGIRLHQLKGHPVWYAQAKKECNVAN